MPRLSSLSGPERPAPLVATLLAAVLAAPLSGQGLEDRLRTLGRENGRLYSRPVSSGLAAGLASGWFHSADPLEPWGVDVSFRAMGALVPEEDETFRPVLPEAITVPELDGRTFSDPYGTGAGLRTPTAAGPGRGVVIPPRGEFRQAIEEEGLDPAEFALRFPDGFDVPAVPMAVLQGSVGLPAGTQVTVRAIPEVEVHEDLGPLSSLGFGLEHSITQWVPGPTPVDVAVEAGVETFDAGDYLTADARHASVVVSRDIGVLTLYGAGGLEDADVEVEYTLDDPRPGREDVRIAFTDEGENTARLSAGFHLDLLFLQLDAGYTLADYQVLNASLGFRF